MKILIRTDGGNVPEIGTGHISRTILLAKQLEKKLKSLSPDITFISQNVREYNYGRKKIKQAGFKVKKISELNEAVRASIKCNKPSVIDVDVDPKALYSFRRDSFKHKEKK